MKSHLIPLFFFCLLLLAATAGADEKVARNLILSQGCKGCHSFEGDGGTLGPTLDRVGSRMRAFQLRQKLLDPKASNPKSAMPGFKHLTENEMKSLVDFLASLK